MHWVSPGHMVWMAFWWIVAIYFIIAAIMFVVDGLRSRADSHESPESILKRRYAAGEINSDEFERRLAELRRTKDAA